ncbi:MAG: pyridoxal phosphate-dependent aminotransferase [Bacteroidales bacterium]|nr:pyridoxal phosphate-dependent aminotransferase [Bacteroidales bacterium]
MKILVDAILLHLSKTRSVDPADEEKEVVITTGAIGAIASSVLCLCSPGEKVLVPDPCWPAIPSIVNMCNAQAEGYPYRTKDDLDTLDHYISHVADASAKMLILINPHNPTGLTLNPEQFVKIFKAIVDKNIFLLCDEVYDNYLPVNYITGNLKYIHFSYKKVLLIGSTSKRYCTPGLRIGYIYGNKEITQSISKSNLLLSGGASPICQATAAYAYNTDESIAPRYREIVEKRRHYTINALNKSGFLVNEDCGSIYVFCQIPGFTSNRIVKFCNHALISGVSVTPGNLFGKSSGDCIRISLSVPLNQLQRAISILIDVKEKMIRNNE